MNQERSSDQGNHHKTNGEPNPRHQRPAHKLIVGYDVADPADPDEKGPSHQAKGQSDTQIVEPNYLGYVLVDIVGRRTNHRGVPHTFYRIRSLRLNNLLFQTDCLDTRFKKWNNALVPRIDQSNENREPSDELVMHHRRSTRWMHWINFPLLAIMIWSGFRIYWADLRDPNVIGVGSFELVQLFPSWFNETLGLKSKLAAGLANHLVFGWIFLINGLIYTVFTVKSGHWRDLNPGRHGIRKALSFIKSSFVKKPASEPSEGYNPAQRIIYNFIVVLGGVSVLTGFAIYRPNTLSWLTTLFGGYQTSKDIHFVATLIFIGFFVVHVLQVLRAGPKALVAMIARPTSTLSPQQLSEQTSTEADAESNDVSNGNDGTKGATELALPSSNRRALITAGITIGATAAGWRWLQGQPKEERLPSPLRAGHEFVESAWRPLDQMSTSARTFAPSKAGEIRVNGRHGIREEIDLEKWSATIIDTTGAEIDSITREDLETLPRTSMTTEHICIEGWSQIVTWTGVRFSDFTDLYRDRLNEYSYVNLATPDGEYYVSLDAQSMQHPFTLLAYELNGEPLTQDHGAPLRLATPVKYGIKQLKRIGSIEYSNSRGPDYWTERGYDWYSHL